MPAPRTIRCRAAVFGLPDGFCTLVVKELSELSTDEVGNEIKTLTGSVGTPMNEPVELTPGVAASYELEVRYEGIKARLQGSFLSPAPAEMKPGDGDEKVTRVHVTASHLLLHADFNEKVNATQGGLPSGLETTMRLPLTELGANAFVSLAVEYTLLRRPSEVRAALAAEAGGVPPPMHEVSVYLSAHGIIATRGAATDSFARLMLVTRGETEWEMGRTEVVQDELTPCFRKTLRFCYSATSLDDE